MSAALEQIRKDYINIITKSCPQGVSPFFKAFGKLNAQ